MSDPQPYNFTLDDTSPVIMYTPYSDGNYTSGWQQWYDGDGFNNATGEDGIGDSFHISSFSGASFQLSFFGVGVELKGTANRSYGIELDDSIQAIDSPPTDVLYSVDGLNPGRHKLQLSLTQDSSNGLVQFDCAIVQSLPPSGTQGNPVPLRIDNQNTSIISYAPGVWTTMTAHQVPSPQHPAPFVRTNTLDAWAAMNFTGSAIAINGIIDYGYWTYQVTLDNTSYSGFNASTFWIAPDAIIFYQDGLNESQPHTINITNTADSMFLSLNSFTVFGFDSPAAGFPPSAIPISSPLPSSTPSNTQSTNTSRHHHSGLSTGGIVGLVIGLAFAAALLLGALLLCRRWKRGSEKPDSEPRQNEFLQVHSSRGPVSSSQFPAGKSRGGLQVESGTPKVGFISLGVEAGRLNDSSPSAPSSYAPPSSVPVPTNRTGGHGHPSSAVLSIDEGNENNSSPYRSRETEHNAAVDRIAALVSERLAQQLRPQESEGRLTPPPEYQSMHPETASEQSRE